MRKAPAPHAAEYKNIVMKGIDGNYLSIPDKNNVYKWVKVHTYEIHDNGSRPYIVYTFGNRVLVYYTTYDAKADTTNVRDKIMDIQYKKLYIGADKPKSKWNPVSKDWGLGNSILVQKSNNTYVHIGAGIYTFTVRPDDTIVDYLSPVGNNDVPYPYAIGKKYIYHMLEWQYFPIPSDFNIKTDVNNYFYAWDIPIKTPKYNELVRERKKDFKKLPHKVVYKRFAFD